MRKAAGPGEGTWFDDREATGRLGPYTSEHP